MGVLVDQIAIISGVVPIRESGWRLYVVNVVKDDIQRDHIIN